MERIQKQGLPMIVDDYETLLQKANMLTLQTDRMKTLATEIFKTFH